MSAPVLHAPNHRASVLTVAPRKEECFRGEVGFTGLGMLYSPMQLLNFRELVDCRGRFQMVGVRGLLALIPETFRHYW